MMVSPNVLQQVYRGSLALNNFGVLLMERGGQDSYQHALSTLQDSLQLLRTLFDTIPMQTSSRDKEGFCPARDNQVLMNVHNSVQRAVSRMAISSAPPEANTPRINIHVVSTGDFDSPRTDLVQQQEPAHHAIYAVRFDDVDSCSDGTFGGVLVSNDDDEEDDDSAADFLEMHVAVVLFNMALARYCMSMTPTIINGQHHPPLTMQLAAMSQDILSRLSARCEEDANMFVLQRRVLCLNSSLAQSLLVILEAFKQTQVLAIPESMIREVKEDLDYLRQALDCISPCCITATHGFGAAAA